MHDPSTPKDAPQKPDQNTSHAPPKEILVQQQQYDPLENKKASMIKAKIYPLALLLQQKILIM